jgi:hypothetical protein
MNVMTALRTQWDRIGAVAAIVVGLVSLFLGYLGVSGTEYVAKQMPYIIANGLFGIFMLGVGTALWLSADLRDEWRELRALRIAVNEHGLASRNEAASAREDVSSR